MIKRLIWTIWTPMSFVLKKADKLNLSLSALPQSITQIKIQPFSFKTMRFKMLFTICQPYCSGFNVANSFKPSDAYMRQWNIPSLVQMTTCRLIGTKPLSEPMLPYYQLDLKEHISVKFHLKFKSFHSWKCI